MPIYRNEGGGVWARLKSVYRYEGNGVWAALKNIYRYEGAGVWAPVFSSAAVPTATTMPTLRNATNVNPDPNNPGTMFFGGDVITLTKGAYANVDADTKYTLTIRRSINFDTTLGNWETVAGPTDLIGSQSGTLTYTVTDLEAKGGYYFAGRVRVDTDPTNPASTDYFFDVKNANALAKVSFTIGSFVVTSITSNGATFSWSTSGLPATDTLTYIYNQKLEVKRTSDNVTVYTQDNIAAATSIVVVSDAQILPTTQYYGVITITANDGWKTSNYPTTQASASSNFTTTAAIPVNTVAPVITPLNNRNYAPLNTQLTCSSGTWTNSPTSYSYAWEYDNGNTQLPPEDRWTIIPGANTNTYTPPSTYVSTYGTKIRCFVTATANSISGLASTTQHFVDSEVTIGSVTPTVTTPNTSTTFSFNINSYPTSYVVDWTNDGVTDYSSGAIPISSVFAISSASGNLSQITYQCNNNFVVGSRVTVTGMSVSAFNVSNAIVRSRTSSSFTINAAVSGSATGGTATSDTSIIYASLPNTYTTSGTATLKITAQPGNKQTTTTITIGSAPTASVSVSPSSGQEGVTTFTATPTVTGSPTPTVTYQWQYNDQGNLWLNAPNSAVSPFTSTAATYRPPSNYTSIYLNSLRCSIVASNGILPNATASSNIVTVLSALVTNPAYGTATRASGGWSATISTQPNPTGGTYSVVSTTAGSATVNSSTGALTASGLSANASSTVTIRYSRSGYMPVDITASGTSLANLTTNPAYGAGASATGGWSATISTQPNPTGGTYSFVSTTAGSANVASASGTVTASGLAAGNSSTVTVRYSLSGYNSVDITATGSATSNVAPFNGSVTVSQSSGSGSISSARWNDVYYVSAATASGTPAVSVSGYQWQRFNLATSTWVSISGETSSSLTINSTHTGATLRCLVTFTNGVAPDLATPSNTISVANPTITNVISYYYSTAPFVIWYVFGYNMQAITSKTIIQGTQQAGNSTSASTNSDAVISGISRQTSVGGTSQTYALIIRPEATAGGGGALGTTVTTNTLTNNATNRTNSPITNTFSPGGSV